MNILKRTYSESDFLMFFTKIILLYSVFINHPNHHYKKDDVNDLTSQVSLCEITFDKNNQTIDKLGEKLIFDFSKNDTLGLISEDKLVIITLDDEGKIIGYKPFASTIPTYWNSKTIKRFLIKNNLFSLSYKKDKLVNFKLSSL
jgi:hypothetical protein